MGEAHVRIARQDEAELRTDARGAGGIQDSAVQLGVLARNSQAQAGAAGVAFAGGIRTPEAVEHQLLLAGLEPHSPVSDGDGHGIFAFHQGQGDGVALGVVDRVSQQVAHDALNATRIAHHGNRVIRYIEFHGHVEFFGQVARLRPGGLDGTAGVHGGGGEFGYASVVTRNLQQVCEQCLEAIQLADHQLGRAACVRFQAVLIIRDHVRSHAHRGQRGAQLMGDVGCELPLQITIFLQLVNLAGEFVGHVVERQRQARHLIFAFDGHALTQVAGGETLRNAGGGTHRRNQLLGGDPRDAHQQHHNHNPGGGKQATHERQGLALGLHVDDQVQLQVRDVGIGRGANDQGVVRPPFMLRGPELVGNLVLGDKIHQALRDGKNLRRCHRAGSCGGQEHDLIGPCCRFILLGALRQRRTRGVQATLGRRRGGGVAQLLFHLGAHANNVCLRVGDLQVDEALRHHRRQREAEHTHDNRGHQQNGGHEAHLE